MIEILRGAFDFERGETVYRVVDDRNRTFNVTAKGQIAFRKLSLVQMDTGEEEKNGDRIMRTALMCEREDVIADSAVWRALA